MLCYKLPGFEGWNSRSFSRKLLEARDLTLGLLGALCMADGLPDPPLPASGYLFVLWHFSVWSILYSGEVFLELLHDLIKYGGLHRVHLVADPFYFLRELGIQLIKDHLHAFDVFQCILEVDVGIPQDESLEYLLRLVKP